MSTSTSIKPALSLVGLIGEFTNHKGQVCQCVVTGKDCDLLIVDYVHPDTLEKIVGAMIGAESFRPDCKP